MFPGLDALRPPVDALSLTVMGSAKPSQSKFPM